MTKELEHQQRYYISSILKERPDIKFLGIGVDRFPIAGKFSSQVFLGFCAAPSDTNPDNIIKQELPYWVSGEVALFYFSLKTEAVHVEFNIPEHLKEFVFSENSNIVSRTIQL